MGSVGTEFKSPDRPVFSTQNVLSGGGPPEPPKNIALGLGASPEPNGPGHILSDRYELARRLRAAMMQLP